MPGDSWCAEAAAQPGVRPEDVAKMAVLWRILAATSQDLAPARPGAKHATQLSEMVLFLVLCVLALSFLLLPDVFKGLGDQMIENPIWGLGVLAVLAMNLVWSYRR